MGGLDRRARGDLRGADDDDPSRTYPAAHTDSTCVNRSVPRPDAAAGTGRSGYGPGRPGRRSPGTPHRCDTPARSPATTAPRSRTRRSTTPTSCPGRTPAARPHPTRTGRSTPADQGARPRPGPTTPDDRPATSRPCPPATGTADHDPPAGTASPSPIIDEYLYKTTNTTYRKRNRLPDPAKPSAKRDHRELGRQHIEVSIHHRGVEFGQDPQPLSGAAVRGAGQSLWDTGQGWVRG